MYLRWESYSPAMLSKAFLICSMGIQPVRHTAGDVLRVGLAVSFPLRVSLGERYSLKRLVASGKVFTGGAVTGGIFEDDGFKKKSGQVRDLPKQA